LVLGAHSSMHIRNGCVGAKIQEEAFGCQTSRAATFESYLQGSGAAWRFRLRTPSM